MKSDRLYHFSENGQITSFHPRPSKAQWDYTPYVWAIDVQHHKHYLLPRDCPRICVNNSSKAGNLLDLHPQIHQNTSGFIAVPARWEATIEKCILYQYEFSPANFHCIDPIAGYYVSEKTEIPTKISKIADCIAAIHDSQTQL
ncbi:MAG: DUF6886 family protein, partial [Bacteroidota bacterium]